MPSDWAPASLRFFPRAGVNESWDFLYNKVFFVVVYCCFFYGGIM